ncbi:hypothetical protein BOX15_Mlig009534g1, partial [Macrostomum lignano]
SQTEVRTQLSKAFRLHGLSLHPEATRTILAAMEHSGQAAVNPAQVIDRLVEAVLRLPLNSCHVQRSEIESLVAEQLLSGTAAAAAAIAADSPWLQVFDAFDPAAPNFRYDRDSRKLAPAPALPRPTSRSESGAESRVQLMRQRYEFLLQRLMRAPGFADCDPLTVGVGGVTGGVSGVIGGSIGKGSGGALRTVEFAKASGPDKQLVVLGMLTRSAEPNRWFLEDPTGVMLLDVSRCRFNEGILAEGCHVLAEGCYRQSEASFLMLEAGLPPAERPTDTRAALGSLNTFGGPATTCARLDARLGERERSSHAHYLVFVSDLWLDDSEVMSKLSLMLTGYSDSPPTGLILCGDFLSPVGRHAPDRVEQLRTGLRRLQALIDSCKPVQQHSTVVLIPGPSDCPLSPLLPYPPLSEAVAGDLGQQQQQRGGGRVVLGSNPCRLQFCTQEIVVYRQQLCEKLCRQALSCPAEGDELSGHFVRTVLSQGHLSPLPLHVSPVLWNLDRTLRLCPLPDLLVLADSACRHFQLRHADCLCVNPGCFKESGFSFHVYLPRRREIQSSCIAD